LFSHIIHLPSFMKHKTYNM